MVALVLMCPKCWHLISLVSASPLSLAGTWPLEARSAQPVMAALISLSQSAQHPIQYISYSSYFLGNNFCLDLAAFISLVHFDQLAQHPISIYFMAEIFSAHNFDFLFIANMFAYMWRPSSYLINACSKEYLFQPFDIWWIMWWWEYSGLLPHHEREQE